MNYTIKIIDTQNDSLVATNERAEGGSVILEWMGGDRKDDLFIVGSSLSLRMVGMSMEDGQYIDLFTGNETRYRVELEDSESVIWSGFILPDSYSEPYSNAPILVNFKATDGLGRLKGKYLSDEFYEEEKSVIEIIAACLRLTGLDLSFRFAPAIENSQQRDYNQIYIDTSYFKESDKKQDAYRILDDLLRSMLCTLYQADNYYNIEGFNIRNLRVYDANIYAPSGELTGVSEVTRNNINITGLDTPYIDMQPPYGIVNISHKREPLKLPETLYKEKNEGWVVYKGLLSSVYSTDWYGKGMYALANAGEEYQVYFDRSPGSMILRNRLYLEKNKKYSLKLHFEIYGEYELHKETYLSNGAWVNAFNLKVSILGESDSEIIFANYGVPENSNKYIEQDFGEEQEIENNLEFIATKSGLLDIEIGGIKNEDNGLTRIYISSVEIEEIGFKDTYLTTRTLNEDYTLVKDQELIYADDASGFSKGFRLQKLRTKNDYNAITVSFNRVLFVDGYYYHTIDLKGANLIKDNIKDVFVNGVKFDVLDVIYNYKNSEEHVIKADSQASGDFKVHIYDYNAITENRDYWHRWTDAIYKVEQIRYPEAIANTYNRLFNKPLATIPNITVKNNVKFNDFISKNWLDRSSWMMSNCRWIIDKGLADITVTENYFGVQEGKNLPPVVEAGDDILIGSGVFSTSLTCEAYDPDGYIVSFLWEELTGNGAVIQSPTSQNTFVSNLTADYYEFRITVADNDGATASDIVRVIRAGEHDFTLVKTDVDFEYHYKVELDPDIPEGSVVNVVGSFYAMSYIKNSNNRGGAAFRIKVNGVYLDERVHELGPDFGGTYMKEERNGEFNVNYFRGDELVFEVYTVAEVMDLSNADPEAVVNFTIDAIEFIDGAGIVNGLPLTTENAE